jgi:hypothetical protein
MNINVKPEARDHFWEAPPPDSMDFWSMGQWKPKCQIGDKIFFRFDGKVVATAIVYNITKPGQEKCDRTGNYANGWKVWWQNESFKDLRHMMFDKQCQASLNRESKQRACLTT